MGRPPREASSRSRPARISCARVTTVARQSGQSRHLDAVAAIRAATDDLPQEDDLVLPLARGDVRIDDARERVGQVGELVVMRGEQRLRAGASVGREVLGDGPGDAQAIEGRCAAANLVEHHQAARCGRVQNVGGFLHLDHERGVTASDVVRCPDAREDAIDDWNLGVAGRYERADLRHERDERSLPEISRLAAHVRPGQDDELTARAVEIDVVGHERVGESLNDRVTAVGDHELVTLVQMRLGVVGDRGRFGQSGQDVERREGARRVLDSRRFGRHARAQRFENLELSREDPLVGAEHLLFVLLERRRRESLASGNRLLTQVVAGHQVQVGLRDLDVVAEDPIESDLERRDAGP